MTFHCQQVLSTRIPTGTPLTSSWSLFDMLQRLPKLTRKLSFTVLLDELVNNPERLGNLHSLLLSHGQFAAASIGVNVDADLIKPRHLRCLELLVVYGSYKNFKLYLPRCFAVSAYFSSCKRTILPNCPQIKMTTSSCSGKVPVKKIDPKRQGGRLRLLYHKNTVFIVE